MNYQQLNKKNIRFEFVKSILDKIYFNVIFWIFIAVLYFASGFIVSFGYISDSVQTLMAYNIIHWTSVILQFIKMTPYFQKLAPDILEINWVLAGMFGQIIGEFCFIGFIGGIMSNNNEKIKINILIPVINVYVNYTLYVFINVILVSFFKNNKYNDARIVYIGASSNVLLSVIFGHVGIYCYTFEYSKLLTIFSVIIFLTSLLKMIHIKYNYNNANNVRIDAENQNENQDENFNIIEYFISLSVTNIINIIWIIAFGIVCVVLFFVYLPYKGWNMDEQYRTQNIIRNVISIVEGSIVLLGILCGIIYCLIKCCMLCKEFMVKEYEEVSNEINNDIEI